MLHHKRRPGRLAHSLVWNGTFVYLLILSEE
jgi:hypothetical protein